MASDDGGDDGLPHYCGGRYDGHYNDHYNGHYDSHYDGHCNDHCNGHCSGHCNGHCDDLTHCDPIESGARSQVPGGDDVDLSYGYSIHLVYDASNIKLHRYSDQVALLRIQVVRYSFLKDLEAAVIHQEMELEFHHISDKNHHSSKNLLQSEKKENSDLQGG